MPPKHKADPSKGCGDIRSFFGNKPNPATDAGNLGVAESPLPMKPNAASANTQSKRNGLAITAKTLAVADATMTDVLNSRLEGDDSRKENNPTTSMTDLTLSVEVQNIMAENSLRAAKRQEAEEALRQALDLARRQAAESGTLLDPKMNREQREAATAPIDRPLMIVAGAGTGKTATILQRVCYFVLHCNVHPSSILLLSFTVKAAKEAQERLEKLGLPGADRIECSTMHSFCYKVLRQYHRSAGFTKIPAVISEDADLRRVMGLCMVRMKVEQLKNELCGWLQVPMRETSWQDVISLVMEEYPQQYEKASTDAVDWFTEKAITKPKKPRKQGAKARAKAALAGKRKAQGEAPTPGLESPKKQSRLAFNGAGSSCMAASAASTPAEVGATTAENAAVEEAATPATLVAAGKLCDMPRELQTSLFAHVYASLWQMFDRQAYNLYDQQCQVSKKKVKDTVAETLLAKRPAKDVKNMMKNLEAAKRRGDSPDQIEDAGLKAMYLLFQQELHAQNAVDFNDLLLHVRALLMRHPYIAERLSTRYRCVVVDEFQDTNAITMEILGALAPAAKSPCLTVVGDGDQSIYRFRGANPHILHAFKVVYDHEQLRRRLELNYRCAPPVLDIAAATLVGNMRDDPNERLVPTKVDQPAEKVTVMELENEASEAKWIVEQILDCVSKGVAFQDTAVLFRAFKTKFGRAYSKLCEELENAGIPYRIVREMSLLQRAAIKDILSYADLLLNPDNDAAFLRVYNSPKRQLGDAVEQKLLIMQEESSVAGQRRSLFDCARELAVSTTGGLRPQQRSNMSNFLKIIDELRANVVVLRPPEILDRIIQRTGYLDYLKAEAERKKKKKVEEEEMENAAENEEGGEDEDSDGEEGSDDEKEEDAGKAATEGAGGSNGVAPGLPWPFVFTCKVTGPLSRLQKEAIRFVRESEPKLGLGTDSSAADSGEDGTTGPPSLESLCYQELSTPQGMSIVQNMLRESVNNASFNPTALEVITAASCCGTGALADFLSFLRLNQSDINAHSVSSAEMGVVISTIHAAKGLEWPLIFIPHFNEGFLPAANALEIDENGGGGGQGPAVNMAAVNGQQNQDPMAMVGVVGAPKLSESKEQMAEERRLAHVAVTRAKDKLFLSYVRTGIFGEQIRSQILDQIMRSCESVIDFQQEPVPEATGNRTWDWRVFR